jgi:broad specificity phosphatase PhoE
MTTAEVIARRHELIVQTSSAWREIDMGQWDGRSLADLYQHDPQSVKLLFEQPESFAYPNGESFVAFNDRIQQAITELVAAQTNTEIALVTHAGVARAIIGTALEMPMRTWLRVAQGFAATNVIDWYDQNPVIQIVNQRDDALRQC